MQNSPSDLTAKDEASTVLHLPAPMNTSNPKKRLLLFALIVSSLLVLLIGGVLSFVIYQNNVNQTNAHNAYLSALSGNGTLVFSDPLSQASGSQWSSSQTNAGACQFEGNAYHIKSQGNYFMSCDAGGKFSNFAFEVHLTIIQDDCGGIVFRDSNNGDGKFYYFCIYEDGKYDIARYANYGIFEHLLPYGHSSAIHTGLGKPNTIAVRAIGSTMTFYVNEQQIQTLQDDGGYTSGSIGLAAYLNADISFTNATLWTL